MANGSKNNRSVTAFTIAARHAQLAQMQHAPLSELHESVPRMATPNTGIVNHQIQQASLSPSAPIGDLHTVSPVSSPAKSTAPTITNSPSFIGETLKRISAKRNADNIVDEPTKQLANSVIDNQVANNAIRFAMAITPAEKLATPKFTETVKKVRAVIQPAIANAIVNTVKEGNVSLNTHPISVVKNSLENIANEVANNVMANNMNSASGPALAAAIRANNLAKTQLPNDIIR